MLNTDRPFFSIIIPCYNSEKTIGRLMDSIVCQNMSDDIEVIIVDDNSPNLENYVSIINKYTDKLNIKFVVTDYNCCPGNSRQKGLDVAAGYWITFIDHDDIFIDDVFKHVKNEIINTEEQNMIVTNIIEYDMESNHVLRNLEKTDNWTHGKFYNLDNFVRKYGLHFKKDMLTHEDIYFSSSIKCVLHHLGIESPRYLDMYTYVWTYNPETISRRKYGERGFLEYFFQDYIDSTVGVYFKQYHDGFIDKDYAIASTIASFLYTYFYFEGFKYHNPSGYDKNNLVKIYRLLGDIEKTFDITANQILDIIYQNNHMYNVIRSNAFVGIGEIIEVDSIFEFVRIIDNELKHNMNEK